MLQQDVVVHCVYICNVLDSMRWQVELSRFVKNLLMLLLIIILDVGGDESG